MNNKTKLLLERLGENSQTYYQFMESKTNQNNLSFLEGCLGYEDKLLLYKQPKT